MRTQESNCLEVAREVVKADIDWLDGEIKALIKKIRG